MTRRRKLLKNLIPHYSRNQPYKQTNKTNKQNKQTNKQTNKTNKQNKQL